MNEKLELIRANLHLNKQEFCKELDITYQTYQNYLKGRDISTDVAIKLNKNFDININWLLTNTGEMFEKKESNYYSINSDSNIVSEPTIKYNSIENTLIEDIKRLSQKRQEYYYHRVKADLIEDELK